MIHKIRAKAPLSRVSGIDTWFGLDFGMNLCRGCQHHSIYCDSRSLCYGNDQFDEDVLVKSNAIDVLRDELRRKRKRGILGTGSMSDPYMPIEERYRLTEGALEAIAEYGFGVHVITKSTLVLRDVGLLQRISRNSTAAVSLSITTIDDELAHRIEPGAPPPLERFLALRALTDAGIEAASPSCPSFRSSRTRPATSVRLSNARKECGVCAKHGICASARPLLAPSADEPGLFA